MDLVARTAEALAWDEVLEALSSCARTTAGARAARALQPLASRELAVEALAATAEVHVVEATGWTLPVGGVLDVRAAVERAAKGTVLEPDSLRAIGVTAIELEDLRLGVEARDELAPTLASFVDTAELDGEVVDTLSRAFDQTGELSARLWPELGDLRKVIQDIAAQVRRTLEELLTRDSLQDILQDHFVAMRGERYVLPIKEHARRWDLGVVHDTSGSGRTVFIEPHEVIELNNRLRAAQGQLEAAERRILALLSRIVMVSSSALLAALDAALKVDLAVARAGLARRLGATQPIVGDEGVVRLNAARHPVLVLRGVDVVANDLLVGGATPVLVLTGPNTGGKTVALKTIGLCAALVRHGCFVPAGADSRVDWFDTLLADIGDAQTVQEGLSSFSAHLVALRELLAAAHPGALLLLDELCTGTDPTQGAALARAVTEALVPLGCAVVLTTHFAQLKALAMTHDRVAMAAVLSVDGKPTFQVIMNATGESHALDAAARMGLPKAVLDRARELQDDVERSLSSALAGLDQQRGAVLSQERRVLAMEASFVEREATLAAREARLQERVGNLERKAEQAFEARLARAEKAVSAVVAELQRDPNHDRVKKARATLQALGGLVREDEPAVVAAPPSLAVGDRVRHLKLGWSGVVVQGGATLQVRAGGLVLRARPEELERLGGPAPAEKAPKFVVSTTLAPRVPELGEAVRIPRNTLDLRGKRVEEALDEVDHFLDRASQEQLGVVFVLHGHGTGAMKQAVRSHLRTHPSVTDSAPASGDQGGDAYTVAVVT